MKRSSYSSKNCFNCGEYHHTAKCYHHLSDAYPDVDCNVCCGCERQDPYDVDRYCINRMIGYCTWCGTAQDTVVGDLVRRYQNYIAITFETTRNQNDVVNLKYYIEMEVKFYRNGSEKHDMQYMTARFDFPLMISYVDESDLCDMNAQITEKMDHFSCLNIDWSVSHINYLRLCSPMEGSFIPTPKWLSLKHAIVNVQCFDDDHNSFQYSVLAGMNVFTDANNKLRASLHTIYEYVEYGW